MCLYDKINWKRKEHRKWNLQVLNTLGRMEAPLCFPPKLLLKPNIGKYVKSISTLWWSDVNDVEEGNLEWSGCTKIYMCYWNYEDRKDMSTPQTYTLNGIVGVEMLNWFGKFVLIDHCILCRFKKKTIAFLK